MCTNKSQFLMQTEVDRKAGHQRRSEDKGPAWGATKAPPTTPSFPNAGCHANDRAGADVANDSEGNFENDNYHCGGVDQQCPTSVLERVELAG